MVVLRESRASRAVCALGLQSGYSKNSHMTEVNHF